MALLSWFASKPMSESAQLKAKHGLSCTSTHMHTHTYLHYLLWQTHTLMGRMGLLTWMSFYSSHWFELESNTSLCSQVLTRFLQLTLESVCQLKFLLVMNSHHVADSGIYEPEFPAGRLFKAADTCWDIFWGFCVVVC